MLHFAQKSRTSKKKAEELIQRSKQRNRDKDELQICNI
jgi:hypothetical protein